MSSAILGVGTALPPNFVAQMEAAEAAKRVCCGDQDQANLLTVLYRQTGIQKRHMVFQQQIVHELATGERTKGAGKEDYAFIPADLQDRGPTTNQRMERYAKEAPILAHQSSQRALDDAHLHASAITHLVTVSCTGFGAPGFDLSLFERLGLAPTVERVHVGFMGCHGALNGLRVASAITGSDRKARVLLCATELCSLHFHYGWDPKKVVGNALFADGSAAVVLGPISEAAPDTWRHSGSGSCVIPGSDYAMSWHIRDHGFEMTLSTKVPILITDNLRPWLDQWLERYDLRVEDIASWAIHPGGPRILNSVEKPLGIDEKATWASREILREHGNMSSPTVLFILKRLREARAPRPCVALGFGPGLAAEAGLFT
jgi:predicted naringenin-chalcone synthase